MSGNSRAYTIGVSHIVVGLSATVEVIPRTGVLSGFVSIHSGGGTLAVTNGISGIASNGYHLGAATADNGKLELEGPAKFYLAAAGATMTASYVQRLSHGATLG